MRRSSPLYLLPAESDFANRRRSKNKRCNYFGAKVYLNPCVLDAESLPASIHYILLLRVPRAPYKNVKLDLYTFCILCNHDECLGFQRHVYDVSRLRTNPTYINQTIVDNCS